MIQSFKDRRTARACDGIAIKGFPAGLLEVARRKLRMLHRATSLGDLRIPPKNMLEALHGDWMGQHSIRVNKRYRVCFVWDDGHAFEVEIADDHR